MRLFIHLLKLGFFIAALALTACSDKDTLVEYLLKFPLKCQR